MNKNYNIVMFGPDLDVMGGISIVVIEYLKAGLGKKTDFTFIPTTKDCSKGKKAVFFLESTVKTISAVLKNKGVFVTFMFLKMVVFTENSEF